MNASLISIYAANVFARKLRGLSEKLARKAGQIEARQSLSAAHKAVVEKNAAFRNKHKGQRAFVIVNGPSLARQDIARLAGELTFVVSGFWKHEAIKLWQPTYYSLLDANFFQNTEPTQLFFKSLNERISGSTFFLPLFRGYDAVHKNHVLPPEKCRFVATTGTQVADNDFSSVVQNFAGVSAFALAQAVYMGCSPIYLLGFDHDYLANRGKDHHFYTGGTIAGHYYTTVTLGERLPYDVEMQANLRLWGDYRGLQAVAQKKGIAVLNATDGGGYLDVFPRVSYDSIEFA